MSSYIEIKDINKSFETDNGRISVLRGINLTIEKGEIYGIIGFSGAGKSTLARCINGLEAPDSGSIIVNGRDIPSLGKAELREERRRIGMIFQTFNLLDSRNVFRNIAMPLEISGTPKGRIRPLVEEAAKVVGLSDKLDAHPGALSGGQKQRVGIARAIVNKPDILLSDEATSALDPQTTLQILDLLKEINEATGLTIVMITHELDAIKYACQRVAVLEEGRVVESGYVQNILNNPSSKTGSLFMKVYHELQQIGPFAGGLGI